MTAVGSPQPEVQHVLRRLDFPHSAREALLCLEKLCLPLAHTRPPTSKQLDYIGEIIDEFVFCETDWKGARKKRLNPVQELQLLEVLLDYFAAGEDKVVLNTVFMMLFTPPHSPSPSPSPSPSTGSRNEMFGPGTAATAGLSDRMRILARLVSSAVTTRNLAVLNCTGVWMQQLSCLSQHSLNLSKVLIEDYFVLHSPQSNSSYSSLCLEQLPQLAPHFTACFLTATAELYGGVGTRGSYIPPPLSLLDAVVSWVSTNPRLCLTPLTLNLQPLLPKGSIVMTSVTPLAGLLRWCVESPLNPSSEKVQVKAERKEASLTYSETSQYSKLHYSLLESMLERLPLQNQQLLLQAEVISPRHLVALVKGLSETFGKNVISPSNIQLTLDRLAQAIQVAQSSGCLYGNIHDLMQLLRTLPYNRLLDIVVRRYS